MKIVTDSAADMPAAELQAFGVVEAPLYIQFPDGEVNSADISADEFYDRLRAMRPAIPTTAQPSSASSPSSTGGSPCQQVASTSMTRMWSSWRAKIGLQVAPGLLPQRKRLGRVSHPGVRC